MFTEKYWVPLTIAGPYGFYKPGRHASYILIVKALLQHTNPFMIPPDTGIKIRDMTDLSGQSSSAGKSE